MTADDFSDAPPKLKQLLQESAAIRDRDVAKCKKTLAENDAEIKEQLKLIRASKNKSGNTLHDMQVAKLRAENEICKKYLDRVKEGIFIFPILKGDDLELGKIGQVKTARHYKVLNVVDAKTMLIVESLGDGDYSDPFMVKGESTKGLVTDFKFDKMDAYAFEVTGTTTYKTVLGASRTVFVLEPYDVAPLKEYLAKRKVDGPGEKKP